ncbi:hypothetical protein IW261DRAFT_1455627 [Armillaria novae-zelandiae]|uniref:F-box domain-containing protein n=1 Tax=Armillaria novae-zelandiae TaxID=153914 RepID=A0AA39PLE2_9AGAR|nr:hypothetical protein IW261DRAFT_1455627 [Armillaria novae-zelandiae]
MTLWLTDNPSPFRDLISVNGVASAKDAILINDYLQKVHGEIQRFEAILKEVQEEKIRLQSAADSHLALMSSFRKFPPEVLATIFQRTVIIPPLEDSRWLPRDMNYIYKELCTLSSVCREWRATVLSTPSLWAQICIGMPWFGRSENRVPLLETMLARSHEADLSIGCSLMEYKQLGLGKQNILALLECVVPTSYRWKHASLELNRVTVDIYEQIRGRLPLLETLRLSSEPLSGVVWEYFCAFERAPRLRELALGEGLFPVNEFPLPWSQITSLYVDYQIEPDDLLAVFSITPNLQFLRMSKQDDDGSDGAWHDDFIVCSTLRQLDVADPSLFHLATLPSLEEISANLCYTDVEEDEQYGEDFFHSFLHRSQCPIQKLTLHFKKSFSSFDWLFDQAFRLTCLEVTLYTMDSTLNLFHMLADTPILPQLQSLKVVWIALEIYSERKDAGLGISVADLFLSRYHSSAATILSVHLKVIQGSRMIDAPPQYVYALGGSFLSEDFWKCFESYLRNTRDLRSRIVTENKECCAIICMNKTTA